MNKTFRLDEFGIEVEIGKYAQQADGAAWVKQGGTVVLATTVSAVSEDFPGFFPLTVDYREQFSAAGKIPGGYLKREGRQTDKEVLTARLIDRAIRPLFPENLFNQVQVLATVYSVDRDHMPNTLALLASSIALSISKIPFISPVGIVEVARKGDTWIYNPTYQQSEESKVTLIVAGTAEGINMVEGCLDEVSEEELVDVLFNAHSYIKKQVAWQLEIQKEIGKEKEPIVDYLDWNAWYAKVGTFLTDDRVKRVFIADKVERAAAFKALKKEFKEVFAQEIIDNNLSEKVVGEVYETELKERITALIFKLNKRLDGRDFETVRNISVEVGLLPFTHGSAMFTRGGTQALVSVTLGGGQDEQKVDDLMGNTIEKSFMLHYNFPPFSVGEVRPMRGPGRREIGHGYLAASALNYVLPDKETFPYTMRIVADMLESNGSTSMATVCGSTMALMQAGVPIAKMVSGVAMGLLQNEASDSFQALTDITGTEDNYGLMDFKVAGTDEGITAIQMDIKYKGGLPRIVFEKALAQAKRGRAHILGEMRKVMTEPNKELSMLVPRVVTLKVPTDKIGAIIGSGGKVIKEIIEKTGTQIDIEDSGLVKIFGQPGQGTEQAVSWVKTLGGLIEAGTVYTGKIKRVAEFGVFVELAPGLDGLVHISTISRDHQKNLAKDYPVDTIAKVQVMDYDESSGRIRLKFI
jgi:polyribonucleotide nucleotidyltransferase